MQYPNRVSKPISAMLMLSIGLISIGFLTRCASKQTEGVEKNSGDAKPIVVQGSGTVCPGVPATAVSNPLTDAVAIDGNKYKLRINQNEQTLCQVLVSSNRRVLLAQVSQQDCHGCKEMFIDLKPRYSRNSNVHFSLNFPDAKLGVNDPANLAAQGLMQTYFGFANGEVVFGFDVNHALTDEIGDKTVPLIVVMDRFQRGYIINYSEIERFKQNGISESDLVDRYLGAKIDGLVNASQ